MYSHVQYENRGVFGVGEGDVAVWTLSLGCQNWLLCAWHVAGLRWRCRWWLPCAKCRSGPVFGPLGSFELTPWEVVGCQGWQGWAGTAWFGVSWPISSGKVVFDPPNPPTPVPSNRLPEVGQGEDDVSQTQTGIARVYLVKYMLCSLSRFSR